MPRGLQGRSRQYVYKQIQINRQIDKQRERKREREGGRGRGRERERGEKWEREGEETRSLSINNNKYSERRRWYIGLRILQNSPTNFIEVLKYFGRGWGILTLPPPSLTFCCILEWFQGIYTQGIVGFLINDNIFYRFRQL